jgi:hypothetical protein
MVLSSVYVDNFQIGYIFLAYRKFTVLCGLVSNYNLSWKIDTDLWKRMMRYGTPIMVAGIAFAINEQFDKILLSKLLPADIAEAEVGVYSACYKLGLFMVLYRTAYTLGIEPFFSAILMIKCTANLRDGNKILCHLWIIYIIVGNRFADLFKLLMIPSSYWEASSAINYFS